MKDAIETELLRRLKKLVNSKRLRMSVTIEESGYVGHWKCLEVSGRASVNVHEDTFYFDFKFRNNNAAEFLENSKLDLPNRPAPKQESGE